MNVKGQIRTIALAFIGLSTVAAAHASLKSEVEAVNKRIAAALMKRDVDRYKKILRSYTSADVVYIYGDQVGGFEQMVGSLRFEFSRYTKMANVSIEVLAVKEHGASGTVTQRHTLEATVKGTRKPHTIAYVEVATDNYRKVNGLWKMVRRSTRFEKFTEDGKAMPVGGPKVPKSGGTAP
jgi:ketosteroid isomerase-like protein